MRRQLNTLYVTTEGAWLKKDGANVVMEVAGEIRGRLPAHMLESLVCIGRVLVSPPLLGYCAEQGISVCYLSPNGKFLARVEGPVSGNVLLRREQYRRSDDQAGCAALVRNLLLGKVHNQRAVLGRALRDHGEVLAEEARVSLSHSHKRLRRITDRLLEAPGVELLRGLEGEAAQAYFGVFDHLIRIDNPTLRFAGRSRPTTSGCGQCTPVLSLHPADTRLSFGVGSRRTGSSRRLPTSRPSRQTQFGAGSTRGVPSRVGRSLGAFPDQPQTIGRTRLPYLGQWRRASQGRGAQDIIDCLSGAQA